MSLLACAVALAAVMVAARAARLGRALGDEVESLSSRVRQLSERVAETPPQPREPLAEDPAAPTPGDGPEVGPRTVH